MKRGLLTAAALLAIAGAATAQETFNFTNVLSQGAAGNSGNDVRTVTFSNSFLWSGSVTVNGVLAEVDTATWASEARFRVETPSNGNGTTGSGWTGTGDFTGTTNVGPTTQNFTGNTGLPFNVLGQTFNLRFFESFVDAASGADSRWDSISITFNAFTPPTPPAGAIDLGTLAPGGMLMAQNPYVANTAQWYKFTLGTAIPASEAFIAHTFGNTLTGGQFGAGDTEIGLYDSLGNLIASNDDAGFPQLWSRVNQGGGLAAGDYYIAAGAYNTIFSSGFNVTVTDAGTPTGDIKLTIIPTPGAMALLGLGGLLATRRRRA